MAKGMTSDVIDSLYGYATGDKPKLNPRDCDFALSLCQQFQNKGKLSDKQIPWVFTLLERAEAADGTLGTMAPKKATHGAIELGDVSKIFESFKKALDNDIAKPSIRFMVGDDKMRMTWSPKWEKISVVQAADFGERIWLGAFDSEGHFTTTTKRKLPDGLVEKLQEFAANPSAAGKATGQRMRWCCFCSSTLTTTDSLYYGYGPICAEKWGLEWGNAKARIKEESMDAIGDFIAQEMQGVR